MLTPDPALRSALEKIPAVDLANNLRASRAAGHSYTAVLAELIRLQMGPGKLSVHEYFYYRLWDSSLSLGEKRQFVGRGRERYLHGACNDEAARPVADDKLLFHKTMLEAGLPVPQLLATVHGKRRIEGVPHLRSAQDVQSFFEKQTEYPVFGKPIDGIFSLGIFLAERYDAQAGTLILHDGASVKIEDCAAEIAGYTQGYLLQQALRPHPDIAAAFGNRLCSVRLLVFLTPEGPLVARATCKIPAGENIADNFWRGNLLGAVDIEGGTIARSVRGTGVTMQVDPRHPDTNAPITGTVVPDWNATLALAIRAAATIPGVRTQSWDIALTDGGPVILEVNYGGDLNLAQLAWGKGVLDEAYRAHLAQCRFRL